MTGLRNALFIFLATLSFAATSAGAATICVPVGVGNADGVGTIVECVEVRNDPSGINPYSGLPGSDGTNSHWPYSRPSGGGSRYTPYSGWSPIPDPTPADYSSWNSSSSTTPTYDWQAESRRLQQEMEAANARMEQDFRVQQRFSEMQAQIQIPAGPPPPLQVTADLGAIAYAIEAIKLNFQTQLARNYNSQIKSEAQDAQKREADIDAAIATLSGSVEREASEAASRLQQFKPDAITRADGLLRAEHVANSRLRTLLEGVSLKSGPNTEEGRRVRQIINAAAVADSEPAAGAAALAVGADLAAANGSAAEAQTLLRQAGVALDIALGFVPGVGAVNDLTQLGFGVVTGRDYNGNEMTTVDYALRGAGVVLGFLPAGSAALRFGDAVITPALVRAVSVLRATGMGQRLAAMARGSFSVMANAAEAISVLFGAGANADDVARTISHLDPALAHTGWEGVKELSQILRSAGIEREERLRLVRSFVIGSIEGRTIPGATSLYRWHNGDDVVREVGRWATFERIGNPATARAVLALPNENLATHLSRLVTRTEVRVFVGTAAPQFGHPGGAVQVFVTGNLHQTLRVAP